MKFYVAILNDDKRYYPRIVNSWMNASMHLNSHNLERDLLQLYRMSRKKNNPPDNLQNLLDLRFININRPRGTSVTLVTLSLVTFVENTYDRKVQMITFARLRFVVRPICDGFVPTIRPNLLLRNSCSLFIYLSFPLFSHSRTS